MRNMKWRGGRRRAGSVAADGGLKVSEQSSSQVSPAEAGSKEASAGGRCGEMLFPFVYDDDAVKQIGCIVCNGRFQEQQAIERFFRIWRVH